MRFLVLVLVLIVSGCAGTQIEPGARQGLTIGRKSLLKAFSGSESIG